MEGREFPIITTIKSTMIIANMRPTMYRSCRNRLSCRECERSHYMHVTEGKSHERSHDMHMTERDES